MTSLRMSPRPASSTSYSPAPPASASSASSTTSTEPTSGTSSSTLTDAKGPPSNEDIEAVIKMATSTRPTPDGRPPPGKDTRTQLFVGNLPYRVRWQDLKDLFRKAGTVLRADVSLGPDNRSRGYGTVLLATAEDAGRAVDMFNGYSWQTRTLEVRLDRLSPDLDPTLHAPNPLTAAYTHSALNGMLAPGMGISMGGVGVPLTVGMGTGSTSSSGFPNHAISPLHQISFMSPQPQTQRHTQPDSAVPTTGMLSMHHPLGMGVNDALFDLGDRKTLFVGNLPFHCQWQDLKDLFRQAGSVLRADVSLGPDGRSRGFGTVSFATEADAEHAVQLFNGHEYNGRTLRVHADRFAQSVNSTLPLAYSLSNSASPQPSFSHAHPFSQQQSQFQTHFHAHGPSFPSQLASPASSSFSSTQNTNTSSNAFSSSSPLVRALGLERRSNFGSSSLESPPSPFPALALPLASGGDEGFSGGVSFARAVSPRLRGLAGKSSGVSTSSPSSGNASQLSLGQAQNQAQAQVQAQLKKINSALGTPVRSDSASALASASSVRVPSSSTASSASVSSTSLPLQLPAGLHGTGASISGNSASLGSNSGGLGGRSVGAASFAPPASSEPSNTSSIPSGRLDGPGAGLSAPTSTKKSRPPPVSLINANSANRDSTGTGSSGSTGDSVSPRSQNQSHHHPAHPGPISLPPPPLSSVFPGPSEPIQLTPGGTGIVGISPLYGPGYGHALVHHVHGQVYGQNSPLATPGHSYHGYGPGPGYPYHSGYPGYPQGHGHVAMTPHGLPPITPSMPSFTFIPQPSPSSAYPSSGNGAGLGGRGSIALSMMGTSPSSANTSAPSSAIGGGATSSPGAGGMNFNLNMNLAMAGGGGMSMMSPLTQHVMGAFSPGSTMSPGAPWGRPGTMLAPPGAVGVVGGPPPGAAAVTTSSMAAESATGGSGGGSAREDSYSNPTVGEGMEDALYGISTPPGIVQASESLGYFPPVPFTDYQQQQERSQGQVLYGTGTSTQGDVGYFPLVPPAPPKENQHSPSQKQQYAPNRKSSLADELIMNNDEDKDSSPSFLGDRHRSSSGGSGPSESEAGTDLGLGGGVDGGRRGTSSIATSWKSGSDDGLVASGNGMVQDIEIGMGALAVSEKPSSPSNLKTQQQYPQQTQSQRSRSASGRNRQTAPQPQPPTLTHKNKSDPDQTGSSTVTTGSRVVPSGGTVRVSSIPWATVVASGLGDARQSGSR